MTFDIIFWIIITIIAILLLAIRVRPISVPLNKYRVLTRKPFIFKNLESSSTHGVAIDNQSGVMPKVLNNVSNKWYSKWFWDISEEKDLLKIEDDEVGIIYAIRGENRESDNKPKDMEVSSFFNAEEFIRGKGEVGVQSRILTPKKNLIINTEIFRLDAVKKEVIEPGKIGLVIALKGNVNKDNFPPRTVECDNYYSAEKFIKEEGSMGLQRDYLTVGTHSINKAFFTIKPTSVTRIPDGEIGIVFAKYGKPLKSGQILGRKVDCKLFQDADAFLGRGEEKNETEKTSKDKNGMEKIGEGQAGPQRAFLRSGEYNINTEIFTVITTENLDNKENQELLGEALDFKLEPRHLRVIDIDSDHIGIITTKIGKPLGDKFAAPKLETMKKSEPFLGIGDNESIDVRIYQDAQAFCDIGGFSGLQLEVLTTRKYYINPLFATVEIIKPIYIPEDKVGVKISSYGETPSNIDEIDKLKSKIDEFDSIENQDLSKKTILNEIDGEKLKKELYRKEREAAVNILSNARKMLVDEGQRGVLKEVLPTGYHKINTKAYKIETVPTNEIILEWDDKVKPSTNYDAELKAIEIFTKDKYKLKVEVSQSIRIHRKDAPVMVTMVGAQGEELAVKDGDKIKEYKSKSIKSLVSKVLASSVKQFFVTAAAQYTAYDFIEAKQSEIRESIEYSITNALLARGVEARNTTFSVVGDSIPKELQERIANEHESTKKIEAWNLEIQEATQEKKTIEITSANELQKKTNELLLAKKEQEKLNTLTEQELHRKKIKEEFKLEIKKEINEIELERLKKEIEIQGGPLLLKTPEIINSLPKQLEKVTNLIIGEGGLDNISKVPEQISILQFLLEHLKSNFPLDKRNKEDKTIG